MNVKNTKYEIMHNMELLMEENAYEDISVSMLVAKSGVSRQAFYKYYSSKEDLCDQMFEYLCRKCVVMEQPFSISEFVANFVIHAAEHATFFNYITSNGMETTVLMVCDSVIEQCLDAMAEWVLQEPLDFRTKALVGAYAMGCAGIVEGVFLNTGKYPLEDIVYLFQDAMPVTLREIFVNRKWPAEVLAPVQQGLHGVLGRQREDRVKLYERIRASMESE